MSEGRPSIIAEVILRLSCGTQSPKPSNIRPRREGGAATLRCRTLNSRAHIRSKPVRSEALLASSRKARVYVVALSKPGVVNHARASEENATLGILHFRG